MKLFAFLLLTLLGVAAAFFRPAVPFQLESIRGGDLSLDANMDHGLDNMEVEEDTNISAARKCGFCMGVSVVFVRDLMMGVVAFLVWLLQSDSNCHGKILPHNVSQGEWLVSRRR
jgi:hypothetical protein